MTEMEESIEGSRSRVRCARQKAFMEKLLRDAVNHPLVYLNLISPETYMVYIEQSRNGSTRKYLSKSLYGSKRSALFRFFRLHNEIGFPERFQAWLKVLYKGFFQNLTQGKTGAVDHPNAAAQILAGDKQNGVDEMKYLPRREMTNVN